MDGLQVASNSIASVAFGLLALVLFGWAGIEYWRTKVHTGIPFQRSHGRRVVTHETISGPYMKITETLPKDERVSTDTTVHQSKKGEFIVEQKVRRADGSTSAL